MQDAKLFVGNLDFTVTSDDLKALFASVGTVTDAVVIMDKMTGRSRGFGFVTMSSADEAKAAVEKLNQNDLKGRKINVNIARPMEPRQ
jgi:RNA recognition motif-containing protein